MLHLLIPKQRVRTVHEINLDELKQMGIKGILTDLDNTLIGAKEPNATPELTEWLARVQHLGFKVVVISNNHELRVRTFAQPLRLPFVHKARKPLASSFHRALSTMSLTASETAVIGDQMMTDILGGNRIGLYTIWVNPIAMADESWFTRHINRNLERFFLSRLRKKGLLP